MTTPPPPAPPAGVCIATTTVPCRLVLRDTTPGKATAWPMLVASCPWPAVDRFGNAQPHAHIHFMTSPVPLLRRAPCNRAAYLLVIARPAA